MTKLVSGRLSAQAPAGPHPGPEVLSAFAENALPEADRGQLLQHLGDCSDCREILYLALPDSPELQKVMVPQPRPFTFRKWALGWGAVVASAAVIAIFLAIPRLGHKNQTASMVADARSGANEAARETESDKKIAAEKAPQDLDQLRASPNAAPPKRTAALENSENRPQPEAKHMTGRMEPPLVFEDSGQVRVQAPVTSANAVAAPMASSNKDERKKENRAVAANGLSQPESAGKPVTYGYTASDASKSKADQQASAGEALSANAGELKSLPVQGRNVQSMPLADKSALGGNLGGVVLDSSGAVVSNAKVTVVGPVGEKTANSDSEGRFSFDSLTAGSYLLKAEASGFKSTEVTQVAVLDNKPANLQVRLDVGTSAEAVEVSAAAATVDASVAAPGAPSTVNSTTELVAHPQQTAQFERQKAGGARQTEVGGSAGAVAAIATPQWKISPEGAVQRSEDRGRTWQVVSVAPGSMFRALWAAGADIWVGGKAGALYHSSDSGQTWTKCEPAIGAKKLDHDIVRVDFAGALSGTVDAANGEVWTTSDGGQTWRRK